MTSTLALIGFILVCFIAAGAGALFMPGAWYARLAKPRWNPPKWLFAPVWSVLYLMIAVSGWLVWREVGFGPASTEPFVVYAIQLVLNGAWTSLFFGLKRMDIALADIMALCVAIIVTIMVFAPISLLAAILLVPYLAWVGFATALNFTLWRLNPTPA